MYAAQIEFPNKSFRNLHFKTHLLWRKYWLSNVKLVFAFAQFNILFIETHSKMVKILSFLCLWIKFYCMNQLTANPVNRLVCHFCSASNEITIPLAFANERGVKLCKNTLCNFLTIFVSPGGCEF